MIQTPRRPWIRNFCNKQEVVVKIAVPSSSPGPDGTVAHQMGTAAHLVIVESDGMSFETLPGPPCASGPGAGVKVMTLAVESGAKVLLVGSVAPHIATALEKRGLTVVMGVSGSVAQAVADYLASKDVSGRARMESGGAAAAKGVPAPPEQWREAAKKGLHQFCAMLPWLIGVVLLLGLFQAFIPQEKLLSLFANAPFLDALWGATLGSVLAGNPVNSYVIGQSMLKAGVSLAGALALMMAWVTVGLIQLPVESGALGMRFALVRNLAGFISAALLSFAVGMWLRGAV